jgi:predicted transcriptional regulator
MHESICFDRRYDEQASRIGTLRAAIERFVREQEHRVQGLDATLAAIERFVREQEHRVQGIDATLALFSDMCSLRFSME